jgi:HK97 family phage major capsid protein
MKKAPYLKMNLQHFAEGGTELKQLQDGFKKSWGELKTLLDQQADEIRNFGETNDQTAQSIKGIEEKVGNYEQELKGITDKYKEFETMLNRKNFNGSEPDFTSVGQVFTKSDAYKNMIETGSKNSQNVQLKSFFTKELDSTDARGGVLTTTQRYPQIVAPVDRDLRLRDLLNVQTTTSNAIEFIQETGYTNNAGTVAEKQVKPQSSIEFELKTSSVKTIAHWIPATLQIIQDATQLRNYVDTRLITGLKIAEENQLLYGSGTGEDLQGIMTHEGIQNVGAPAGDDTIIDHIRRAITRSIVAGYPVTGIVLHPVDFEQIELQKGGDGHYIWISVPNGGEPRLFRVPVVQSLGILEGEFLLGSFGLGAQVWDRMQANIRVSESHSDFFIRNMIAILCEERIAQTIYRPESFVRGLTRGA